MSEVKDIFRHRRSDVAACLAWLAWCREL